MDGVFDTVRDTLARRDEVLEVYVFGSVARGDVKPHSDLDVAVYVTAIPDAPFGYAAELASELMGALRAARVDIVVLNRAGPALYHRVLRDGVRVFARDVTATTRREGQALSRYCDYVPQLAKIDRVVSKRIGRGDLGR